MMTCRISLPAWDSRRKQSFKTCTLPILILFRSSRFNSQELRQVITQRPARNTSRIRSTSYLRKADKKGSLVSELLLLCCLSGPPYNVAFVKLRQQAVGSLISICPLPVFEGARSPFSAPSIRDNNCAYGVARLRFHQSLLGSKPEMPQGASHEHLFAGMATPRL